MKQFQPSQQLSPDQVQKGLNLVVKDGLFTEAMTTMTGGAFLVALAVKLGASNFQIGLLAALPTLANIFQMLAIYLVQRYSNRRILAVICSFAARFPLLLIAVLPLMFSAGTSLQAMIFLLFFHYFFGAMVGPLWNSWMKDLVPSQKLGSYFAHRTRMIQILNVSLSLVVALTLDHIKSNYPAWEIYAYIGMFIVGGILGIASVFMLSKTPEPQMAKMDANIFKLISRPFRNRNYRNLLIFQSSWSFALNLATPFFSVYLMKSLSLPLSYIIGLNIISQISSIFFIKIWGRYSDQFSNKTIIGICAPLYAFAILGWTFTGIESISLPLLVLIYLISGVATSGINLAIANIGIKLAPKEEAIVYIAARSMTMGLIPSLAPIIGGVIADFFHLSQWTIFFALGSLLAMASLKLLTFVKEEGEVSRDLVLQKMLHRLKVRFQFQFQRKILKTFLLLPLQGKKIK
jgi:MFS family permease